MSVNSLIMRMHPLVDFSDSTKAADDVVSTSETTTDGLESLVGRECP